MTKLINIFNIIDSENIIIEEANLNNMMSKGIYFKFDNIPPIIAIEKSIISYTYMYISILAEELGHHFTTQGNLLESSKNYSEKLIKNKKETLAKKWAANFLISDEEFVQAILNCINNKYELSEKFDVTEDIINYKILSICIDENKYNDIKNKLKMHEVAYSACEI